MRDVVDEAFGRLVTGPGYTLEYIGRLTPDDTAKLFRYWARNPQAHEILLAVHAKPKNKRDTQQQSNAGLEQELIAQGLLKVNRPKHV
jgi:hypothetical protein